MYIKSGMDGRKNNSRPKNTPFSLINLYKDRDNLRKRINFQIKVKRKYLFTIKKLRKERQELREQLRASDILLSKLNANSVPKV